MYYILRKKAQATNPNTSITTSVSRTYPTGELIPEQLPASYGIAQKCSNCVAYNPKTTICSTYLAMVKPDYWCSSWKGE